MNQGKAILAFLITAAAATFAIGAGPDDADKILGLPGKDLPGEVRRYSWPRTDLQVEVAGIRIEPPLALGSSICTTARGVPW
jgi:hypothetical protein